MQVLTEAIYHLTPPGGLFDTTVLRALFPAKSDGARKLLVQRALRASEIVRLKPGLFCLAEPFRRSHPHPFAIAELLHFPSHVSMESALWHHGAIPEAVRETTSVSALRSRSFTNFFGVFSFTRVPADVPRAGVRLVELGGPMRAHVATVARAIADLVYFRSETTWKAHGIGFLTDSLRIDLDELGAIDLDELDEVIAGIRSARTRRFLRGLQQELGR
jgi:hypothetical protein